MPVKFSYRERQMEIAPRHNLRVGEDACQAIGASRDGKAAGRVL